MFLSVPLHSAVAARIFIEIQLSKKNIEEFPANVDDQAIWWATIYTNSTGNITYYISTVQSYEEANRKLCVDVGFYCSD